MNDVVAGGVFLCQTPFNRVGVGFEHGLNYIWNTLLLVNAAIVRLCQQIEPWFEHESVLSIATADTCVLGFRDYAVYVTCGAPNHAVECIGNGYLVEVCAEDFAIEVDGDVYGGANQ